MRPEITPILLAALSVVLPVVVYSRDTGRD
jgi:hypothetical protein